MLIDCGEGTQMQMQRYNISAQRINHIFISHLHGDHFYGLIGLLSTFHLNRREKPLHLYAHKQLKEIINMQLEASQTKLLYPLHFHEIIPGRKQLLLDHTYFTVTTFPLLHGVPSNGFLIREKNGLRRIVKEKIANRDLPHEAFRSLKAGHDYRMPNGEVLDTDTFTMPPKGQRSYAFCSDTGYFPDMFDEIKQVALLYHEATFMEEDVPNEKLARFHSTARQAAETALQVGAEQLLIGHFSSRYTSLEPLLEEAKEVFPNTLLAVDGNTYPVNFPSEAS